LPKSAQQSEEPQQEQAPTILYIVRHTDVHNPQDILYGRLPRFRLSTEGLHQDEVTASVLSEEPVSVFYTSPRLRARQTTRILAMPHPDVPVHVTRLLDEVLTAWQGRPHVDLEAHSFNFYANRLAPSDETLEQVWQRVQRFVRRARKRHPGEMVVAVTHGDPVMLTRAGYLGMPITIESLRRPNLYVGKGSLTRLTFPADLRQTYPLSVEYYDPNSQDGPWSHGWVKLGSEGLKV